MRATLSARVIVRKGVKCDPATRNAARVVCFESLRRRFARKWRISPCGNIFAEHIDFAQLLRPCGQKRGAGKVSPPSAIDNNANITNKIVMGQIVETMNRARKTARTRGPIVASSH